MNKLDVEHRPFNRTGLAFDLANHLRVNLASGNAAVIAERPHELMGETKRQILKVTRRLQRQRKDASDVSRLVELSNAISRLQSWRFSAEADDFTATVLFGTVAQFIANPPSPQILYVTHPVGSVELNMVSAWMKAGELVVIYG